MGLPNFYKKKLMIRNLPTQNVNSLKFVQSAVIYYPLKKDYAFSSIVSCSAILKLISLKTPAILRARRSSALLKIRKGAPVGSKVSLRNKNLDSFYLRLLHQILPQLSTFKLVADFEKNKELVVTIKISDVFLFPELRAFYFYFNRFTDLRITLKFNKILGQLAPKFLFSLYEYPIKQG